MHLRLRSPKLFAAGLLSMGLIVGSATAAGASTNVNLALSITGGGIRNSAHTAWQVNNDTGLVVGDANRAEAVSVSCANCRTVAVAVQVDLAAGPVVRVNASNKADSTQRKTVNSDSCANAWQFVIAPDEMVVFTPGAKAAIAVVEAQVKASVSSTETCAQVTADVTSDMGTLAGILSDPGSYAPGTPTGHVFPHLTVNQFHTAQ